MDAFLSRAQLLLEMSRYPEAEEELKRGLAASPDHAFAHALLGACYLEQEKFDPATREAQTAIGLEPDLAYAHYVFALILSRRHRNAEAYAALREALRLDPDAVHLYALLSQIHMDERRWTEALEAADRGLKIDAEDVACNNLRAMALTRLNRRDEAGATMDATLSRNPDVSLSHANQGWTLLHSGDPKKAMEHFREALRLEPDSEWAKAGIVEALKARNFIYGIMLRYFLFMARLSGQAQWAIILGGFFGNRMLLSLAKANPSWAPWIKPITMAYFAFCIMTWIAYPLFNLFLRFHPFGKYALSDDQKRGANWVGACILLALISLVCWLGFHLQHAEIYAVTFGLILLPLAGTVGCSPGWPRRAMAIYTGLLFGLMVAGLGILYFWTGPVVRGQRMFDLLSNLFVLGCILSGFAANIAGSITPKK